MALSDEDVKSLFEKAEAYKKLGNYEEALKIYEKIIEQKPDYVMAWENKGDVLSRLNRDEEARSAYEKAAEYGDSIHVCWCYFRIIAKYIFSIEGKEEFSRDRDLEKFARELDIGTISMELREFFKENKYLLSEKAKVEKIKEANGINCNRILRIKDEDKVYILRRFSSYTEINIYLENAPPHSHYYVKHAQLLQLSLPSFNLDEAIGDMDRAIELDPGTGEYYRYRGELLLKKVYEDDKKISTEKKSFFEKVIADYKTSLERNPSDPEIWLLLMELNILLHNWDDAISIYGSCRRFIQTNKDQLIRVWLGCTALALAGDPIEEEDKRPLYDQTIRLESASRMLRIISNSFINEIQEKEEYKEKWEKAIEIHKLFIEHFDDWEDRGDMLERLRCYQEAVETYNRAIGLKPDHAEICKAKGDVSIMKKAIQAYDRAIELRGKDYGLALTAVIGKELASFGRYDEALRAFDKAIEVSPVDAMGWYFRACIYSLKNEKESTLTNLSKAIELNINYKDMAKKEEDFKTLWEDEDFKRIVG